MQGSPGGYGGPPGYGQPPGYGPQPGYAPPQAQPAAYGAPGAAQYGNYEFNDAENAVIGACGSRTLTWGIIQIVMGALIALAAIFVFIAGIIALVNGNFGPLFIGFIYVIEAAIVVFLGIQWARAGSSLKKVVTTQGNDIALLMSALTQMGRAFLTLTILTVAGFVLGIIGFVLIFVFAAAATVMR